MPVAPLLAVSRLTTAIAKADSLAAVHDAALGAIQDALGVSRASILLFDSDGVMRFKAWRGLSDEYRAAVEGHTPWRPGEPAPDPIVVSDVAGEPSLERYRSVFVRERIAAMAFIPIVSSSGVVGKFMLYAETPRTFSDAEVATATAFGILIGFAFERTRTALEAQAEQRRMLFALDAANMGTWQWNMHTQQVRWSENLERIHGLPPGTFSGDFASYEREIHPEDRPRVFASIQNALRTGAPHDVEYRIVAPDGSMRWVHGKGRVEYTERGEPMRMTGVCMDISDRKRVEQENARLYEDAQRALREEAAARERLTLLMDGSQRLLTALTPDAVIAEVLALAERAIAADGYAVWRQYGNEWRVAGARGLSPEFISDSITGRPAKFERPLVAVRAADVPLLDTRRAAYDREGIVSLVSVPLAIRGGTSGSIVFYYRSHHEPAEVEIRLANSLGQLAAAAIDISELYNEQQQLRREAEAAQQRSAFLAEASAGLSSLDYEANLRTIATLAVPRLCDWCVVDLRDERGEVNRIAIQHIDPARIQEAEELQRRYPTDLTQPRGIGQVLRTGRPELYPEISDALLESTARDPEHLRMLRKVGMRSVMIVPLAGRDRVFGTITFVSARETLRFGDADLQMALELGRRAALSIENARLFRELQEANRLKDEFLATLSHELRTPLNVIVGRARMLNPGDPVQVNQARDAIERNSQLLARLVDDLLDVSRISVGLLKLERQRVDAAALLEGAVQSVLPAAHAKGITVHADIDAAAPLVPGDPTRLQQVMWNLLSNAVKFTPAGGQIAVRLTADPARVAMSVSDSGEGIDPGFLPYVFDMFRQGEPAHSRRHGGLGLGLSIVRRLVELHGGEVTAESAGRGRGATFTVRLPHAGSGATAAES